MRVAVHTPHPPAHFWIEDYPICRVDPLPRNAFGGTGPGAAAVFATKQTDVCISNKLPIGVERIEVNSVRGCYVQTSRSPGCARFFAGIQSGPSCAAIGCAHG